MLGLAGALCVLAGAAGAGAPPALAASVSPFAGTALWVDEAPPTSTPEELAGQAAQAGSRTLWVKAGDGSTPDLQFSPALVAGLRAAGVTVCAWTFAYGVDPAGEAAVAVAAARAGARCLVVDAEEQYDGRYGAAQAYVRALRAQLGASFPIGL
ncbi:MAG TPA: hypothetical protein VKV16_03450, partial [Solirubrobacteraceae bacterium]|nr:hypothetical protein [Solirubrobacteraceae bacterium]